MIILFISNFFAILMAISITKSFCKLRTSNAVYNNIIFCFAFIVLCLSNYTEVSTSTAIISLLCSIMCLPLVFKGTITNFIFSIVSLFIIIIVSEVTISLLFYLVFGMDEILKSSSIAYSVALLLSNLLGFTLIHYIIKVTKSFEIKKLPKYSYIIFILPLTTLFLFLNIKDYYEIVLLSSSLQLIIFGLFFSNVVALYTFFKAISAIQLQNELEIIKFQEKNTEDKLLLLSQHHENHFTILHNLLNDCKSMKDSLINKNYHELQEKLDVLTQKTFNEFEMIYSNSHVVNTIINSKINILNEYNISINPIIEYNEFYFLKKIDLVELFNLLINFGIENCCLSNKDDRVIILKSLVMNNQVLIQLIIPQTSSVSIHIINNFENDIKSLIKKYDGILSKKEEFNLDCKSYLIIFQNNFYHQ